MILTSLSADELERFALCAMQPELRAAAQAELDARGVSPSHIKDAELAALDDEIEQCEEEVRSAERQVEYAEDKLLDARKRRKERETLP